MSLSKVLADLTEREKCIVRLRYGIGDSHHLNIREVAAVMQSSEVAITAELKTAVQKIRRNVENDTQARIVLRRCNIPFVGEIS